MEVYAGKDVTVPAVINHLYKCNTEQGEALGKLSLINK